MSSLVARMLGAALVFLLPALARAGEAAPANPSPALWRITHETSTLYLFGSMHVLPKDFSWTTPAIETAKAESGRFIFEVPVDEGALKEEKEFIIQNGIMPRRQTLRGRLSANEFQTYSSVLRRAGLPPAQFERYRPWLASIVLGLAYLHQENFVALKGADDALINFARANGRELRYLESVRDQMQLITGGDESGQLKALKRLISTLSRSRTQERELFGSWISGDAAGLTALLEGYFRGSPGAKEILVDRRNRNWLPTLKEVLAEPNTTTMVTVGAAHVGGGQGLIALLCGQGYQVMRVADQKASEHNACGPGA